MVARGIKEVIRGLKLSVLFPWIPGRGERLEIVSVARDQRFNQSWLRNWASLVVQRVKNLPAGDTGSMPECRRSSGEGNGYPLLCNNTLIKPQKDKSIKLPMGEYEEILGEFPAGRGHGNTVPLLTYIALCAFFHLAILLWCPFIISCLSSIFSEFCESLKQLLNLKRGVMGTSDLQPIRSIGDKLAFFWCLKWGQSCGTESVLCGIWGYYQVDSVRINYLIRAKGLWCGGKHTHTHTHWSMCEKTLGIWFIVSFKRGNPLMWELRELLWS